MVSERVVSVLALAVVVATALSALWTPFGVDQALFAYGARAISNGDILYRDFWDIKPPGIFAFYLGASLLFGDTEVGIHAADLLWQICLALVLLRLARSGVDHPAAAFVAPFAALSLYWLHGGSEHLTQVEALVGLPIATSLLLVLESATRGPSAPKALLLGVMAGLIMAMKPLYVALPASFVLVAVLRSRSAHRRLEPARVGSLAGMLVVGVGLVWLPMVGYFSYHGIFHEFAWTTFVYPSEALREVSAAPLKRLTSSATWLLRVWAPYLPLLVCGLATWRRPRQPLLAYGVAAYLAVGTGVLIVQRFSWWEYHFVLLFPPLGLLASFGLDWLLGLRPLSRQPVILATGLAAMTLLFPVADLVAGTTSRVRRIDAARQLNTTASLPIRLDRGYLKIWHRTEFLRDPSQSLPGPIFVFGDFRHLLSSQRRQAIATHGHAWHHLPNHLVQEQADRLMAAQPTYIFVGGFYRDFLEQTTPRLWRYLQRNYRPVEKHGNGRWYQRRGSGKRRR